MTPPEAVSAARTRVMLAFLAVYRREGRATVRTVANEADRAIGSTVKSLAVLRAEGLIRWEPGTSGTLRPLFDDPWTFSPEPAE